MHRRSKILFLYVIFALIFISAFYLLFRSSHLSNDDGFFFERLCNWIPIFSSNSDILSYQYIMPFAPIFLQIISQMTGLNIIDVSFLPLIPIAMLFATLLFAKKVISDHIAIIIIGILILFRQFILASHFQEYLMAQVMYVFFVACLYMYYVQTHGKAKVVYLIFALVFLLQTKYYGPPMELWVLTLTCTLLIVMGTQDLIKYSIIRSQTGSILILFILSLVIFAYFNPKIYEQLVHMEGSLSILGNTILSTLEMAFSGSSTHLGELETVRSSPLALKVNNLLYTIILAIVPLICVMVLTIKEKNLFFWLRKPHSTYMAILVVPFIAEYALYSIIGLTTLRYYYLIMPFVCIYWLLQVDQRRIFFRIISSLLIILTCSYFCLYIHYDINYSFVGEDSTSTLIQFMDKFSPQEKLQTQEVMIDHHSLGEIKTYLSNNLGESNTFNFIQYNVERYKDLINSNPSCDSMLRYTIVNIDNYDKPIRKGLPDWTYYEPISQYDVQVESNYNINKIYRSKDYCVFVSNPI